MLIQCFNDSFLHQSLIDSSLVLIKCISKAHSFDLESKYHDIFSFEIEQKGRNNLTKKQFTLLHHPDTKTKYVTHLTDEMLMLIEMGYTSVLKMINDLKKSHILWVYSLKLNYEE